MQVTDVTVTLKKVQYYILESRGKEYERLIINVTIGDLLRLFLAIYEEELK